MSKKTTTFAAIALSALAGQTLAGQVTNTFLATNGTTAYIFQQGSAPAQTEQFTFANAPESVQAISNDINGRVVLHGNRTDGTGVWYALQQNGGNFNANLITQTATWYNSFTMAGEQMFAVKNIANDLDQIVELNPFTFEEIGTVGSLDLGIGGIAWVPELGEFIVSDTRTNTFWGVSINSGPANSTSTRLLGSAGLRWGGNGLEYANGHVYGTGIRGEDMKLVFGEVNLQTGAFDVQSVLGDAARSGVGFGIVPTPGVLSLVGAGGLLMVRRRRN